MANNEDRDRFDFSDPLPPPESQWRKRDTRRAADDLHDDGEPRNWRIERAQHAMHTPSIVVSIGSSLLMVSGFLALALVAFTTLFLNDAMSDAAKKERPELLGFGLAGLLTGAFCLAGSIHARNFRYYTWAMFAGVVFTLASCGSLIGLIFGIWYLTALRKESVLDAFYERANQRRR